jgi:hypothetical protein
VADYCRIRRRFYSDCYAATLTPLTSATAGGVLFAVFRRGKTRTVAIVWRSRGTIGPDSLDAGTSLPLVIIDKRLKNFRIFCHGESPKTMLPQSRGGYYTHVMIEVLDDDLQPHLERFPRPGFYQVVGLRACDAGFLFESTDLSSTPEKASLYRRV